MKAHTAPDSQKPTGQSARLSIEGLYTCYYPRIYRQCLRFTKNPELAQDFTQDIFLKLFDKLPTFQGNAHVTSWLHTLTCNYCLDQLKLARRLPLQPLAAQLEDIAEEHPGESGDEELAWRVYEQLPLETQRLFRSKYEQGLSLKSLAREWECSVAALKMRLLRSRQQARLAYQTQRSRKA